MTLQKNLLKWKNELSSVTVLIITIIYKLVFEL